MYIFLITLYLSLSITISIRPSVYLPTIQLSIYLFKVAVPITMSLTVMLGYICGGAILFGEWEGWSFLNGFYFCFITLRDNIYIYSHNRIWKTRRMIIFHKVYTRNFKLLEHRRFVLFAWFFSILHLVVKTLWQRNFSINVYFRCYS